MKRWEFPLQTRELCSSKSWQNPPWMCWQHFYHLDIHWETWARLAFNCIAHPHRSCLESSSGLFNTLWLQLYWCEQNHSSLERWGKTSISCSSLIGISPESVTNEPICFIITRGIQRSQRMGQTTKMSSEIKDEGREKTEKKELMDWKPGACFQTPCPSILSSGECHRHCVS